MALSQGEIITKTLARLAPQTQQQAGIYRPQIVACFAAALRKLALMVAQGPEKRLLQRSYGFTLDGAQSADLGGASGLAAAEPLIITRPFPAVRVNSVESYWIADLQSLNIRPTDDNAIAYTEEANVLYCLGPSDLTGQPVVVTANYIPAIAHWPPQFEPALIEALIEEVRSAMQQQVAA